VLEKPLLEDILALPIGEARLQIAKYERKKKREGKIKGNVAKIILERERASSSFFHAAI